MNDITTNPLSASARRVQDALQTLGLDCQVRELAQSTRTAADAAASVDCQLGQIVKSLIFRTQHSDQAILVAVSGRNRLSEKKLSALIGEPITRPDADFVRVRTGFAIGGVAPVGHLTTLPAYIDIDLLQYNTVWAAAGTPSALFMTTPTDLITMTQGTIADIKLDESIAT